MINYQAFGLVRWLVLLQQEQGIATGKHMLLMQVMAGVQATSADPPQDAPAIPRDAVRITDEDRNRLNGFLNYGDRLCDQL